MRKPKFDGCSGMMSLLDLVEVNNVPEVYQEIARAFLAGLAFYEIKSR